MIEVLFILIAMLAMAKHRRRRRKINWSTYLSGAIEIRANLGTLAGKTLLTFPVGSNVSDTTRVGSIKCIYSLSGMTAGDNIGPIAVGVAHSDYTSVEIEAYLEATGSWDRGDMVQREVRSRRVRLIGVFNTPATVGESSRLNDGRPVKTKLNWVLSEDDTLDFWFFNMGTGALATTDPQVNVIGKANLWVV